MSFNLVLNSTNVSNVNNNIFTYNFINGGFKISQDALLKSPWSFV